MPKLTDFAALKAALSDRYTIEHELGAGGMATVYLAHDVKHDHKVAIKVLCPELAAVIGAERFLAEIKTTANLQHPHILPLFDSGAVVVPHPERSEGPQSFLFYVMPFIDGVSLRDRITREHQLPVEDAVRIAREVAAALDYAHRHGVIHRDIKPENILLHDGSALVADFGIALAVSTAGTRMTETGMSRGTPHYMSPEQAMGEREITARSDVYALGCITYEMLVGEPPFTGPTAQAIIARVMNEEPRQLAIQRKSIPPQVEDAVLHALEKLPADRFATAAQFAEALAVLAVALAAWGWLRAHAADDRPISRRYISLGDSVQIQTAANVGMPLSLSPDGSRLAFVGDTLGRIWIKRRDVIEPSVLPGGDGGVVATPFDLSKLEVTGPSVPVLQGVAQTHFRTELAWSRTGLLIYGVGGPASDLLTLKQVDRNGAETSFDPSWLREFNSFALSPDGQRVAAGVTTPGSGLDIWIKQLARGPFTRLTFSGSDRRPTWSPGGREVAFVRDSGSGGDVYTRAIDGTGTDRRLAHLDRAIQEVIWSHDGRWLLVHTETAAQGAGDIVAVRASGDSGIIDLAISPFTEVQPALAPDERWVTYVSNESGTNEVYVPPFPNSSAGRWPVSNGGGGSPVWSADGREIYYLDAGNRMMVATVAPGATFTVSDRKPLFDASAFNDVGYHQVLDVTRDGHFLYLGPVGPVKAATTRLVEVDNWFADIRARLKQ